MGVPQGSILGPLLYILYTNELPCILNKPIIQFADDASIIFSEPRKNPNIEENVFKSLATLENWFASLNLKLNVNKTQLINFSYKKNEQLILSNGTQILSSTENVMFLGIGVDSRLDWKYHIDLLASNMSKYAYALKILSQQINCETAFIAYHAYIQSRIRYGIIFWGNSTDVNRISVLQKRCIRSILNMKLTDTCKHIFKERNILTLVCIYIYESIIFLSENKQLFSSNERDHEHNTRTKQNLINEKTNLTYIQKNVCHMIIKIYNKCSPEIRNLPTHILKLNLKKFLLKKAYYTLDEYFNDHIHFK